MAEHVALYVLPSCPKSADEVLKTIRSSDFIDEINSGEGPREECGLYKLIQPVLTKVSSVEEAVKDLGNQGGDWNKLCVIVADEEASNDVVMAVSVNDKTKQEKDRLKCKASSVVEVASNVSIANMGLGEYRDMCGGADVYDAAQ